MSRRPTEFNSSPSSSPSPARPPVFLVPRMAMSDAISHTVLLGIVLGFFAIGSLESPLPRPGRRGHGRADGQLVELCSCAPISCARRGHRSGLPGPVQHRRHPHLSLRPRRPPHVDAVPLGELA